MIDEEQDSSIDSTENYVDKQEFSKNADTNANWTNRRFMAYISLFSLVGLALAAIVIAMISTTILEAIIPIISVFVMAFGSIVGAYMGLATYADKWMITKGR